MQIDGLHPEHGIVTFLEPFANLSHAFRGFSTFDFEKPVVKTWFLGFC